MPINVFGNSNSNNSDNKIDTSLLVKKPFVRTNYIEANIEEDIDQTSQFRIKNLPDPISFRIAASKLYVDIKYNNDIDFNEKNLGKLKFVKVNNKPAVDRHLTQKIYVDNAIDERPIVRKKIT